MKKRLLIRNPADQEELFDSDDYESKYKFDNDDYEKLFEQALNAVANYFDYDWASDYLIHNAEEYLDYGADLKEKVIDSLDSETDRIEDEESRRAWLVLDPKRSAGSEALRSFLESVDLPENTEFFDERTLNALQRNWRESLEENAVIGSHWYEIKVFEDEEDAQDFSEIVIYQDTLKETFAYDGHPIDSGGLELMSFYDLAQSEDNEEIFKELRQRFEEAASGSPRRRPSHTFAAFRQRQALVDAAYRTVFTPSPGLDERLTANGLSVRQIFEDWLDPCFDEGDCEIYVNPLAETLNTTLYAYVNQDELWTYLSNDTVGDDEWLSSALGGPYEEEILDAWRSIVFGDASREDSRALKKALAGGDSETQELMSFEAEGAVFEFVDLLNYAALKAQGRKLGQCLGNRQYGHPAALESGEAKYISMQTAGGKTKLTVQAYLDDDGDITKFGEIRGSGNRLPGFSNTQGTGKFKPTEVEVLLAFLEEIAPGVDYSNNSHLEPALAKLEGRKIPTRKNPAEETSTMAFSRPFEWGRE